MLSRHESKRIVDGSWDNSRTNTLMIRCIDVKLAITPLRSVPCFPLFASCQPSDVLEQKTTFLGMQPRKVTLTGSVLTKCNLTKGGRGTKACEVCALWHSRPYSKFCNSQEVVRY